MLPWVPSPLLLHADVGVHVKLLDRPSDLRLALAAISMLRCRLSGGHSLSNYRLIDRSVSRRRRGKEKAECKTQCMGENEVRSFIPCLALKYSRNQFIRKSS